MNVAVDMAALQAVLERDTAELNLALHKENDAIAHRKVCQAAHVNSRSAFELGCSEVAVATAAVYKAS